MSNERTRVFITGASGFLGGALAGALMKEGAEVHALWRRKSAPRPSRDCPIVWHQGDVTVRESLKGLFDGMQWIIHAAGHLGQAGVPERTYVSVNVEGVRNVLAEAYATENQPRILHLSSPGILGPTGKEPLAEDAPLAATNSYERSKAAAEQIALEYAAKGLSVVVARPGFVYGPGDKHVLGLFKAVKAGRFFYIDGGRRLCQPTFVTDVVDGMLACLRRGVTGEVYHLSGPRAISFRELAEIVAAAVDSPAPRWSVPRWSAMLGATILEFAGHMSGQTPPLSRTGVSFFSEHRVFSSRKAYDNVGYAPRHDPETGVPITVSWYRRHGWL